MVILKAEKENATEIYARTTCDEYAHVQGMRLMIYGGVRLHQTMSYFKGLLYGLSRTVTTQSDSALVEMEIEHDE